MQITFSEAIQTLSLFIALLAFALTNIYNINTLKGIRKQLYLNVYIEYTRRYFEIIQQLPSSRAHTDISLFENASENGVMDYLAVMRAYYDLTSEEYFLHKSGYLDTDTWKIWEAGIKATIVLPSYREGWHRIRKEGYEDDFIEYIDRILNSTLNSKF